ncbi:MAG: heme-binding protein [Calditrichota bacterium]
MRILFVLLGIATLLLLVWGYKFSRLGLESPSYQVVQQDGEFEIREYPSMVVVSTSMKSSMPNDGSFMRLFRYISGSNETGQKIAMTTPVLMTQDGEASQMSFVVPKEVADTGAPEADGEQVEIETIAAGKFAAYRYSGDQNRKAFQQAITRLESWLRENDRIAIDTPIAASYDPPFTPAMLKRNEVLVRIQ